MPRLNTISRQQIILDLLKDGNEEATFEKIMVVIGGEFSAKTIQRDLSELRKKGAKITCNGKGRKTVYELTNDDFRLPDTFSATDLLSLTILRQAIRGYSGAYLENQVKNLAARIGKATMEDREYTAADIDAAITFRPPPARPVDPMLWEAVLNATLKKSELQFDYQGRQGVCRRISVQPFHMVCCEGEWYLLAGTPDDPNPMQYSLAGMLNWEAVPGRNHFARPQDFNARALLQNSFGGFMSSGPTKTVRVQVSGLMVRYIQNRMFQPQQKVKELDGGKVLEISFPAVASGPVPFGNVASWVLGMGPYAKVLEPPELIDRVREEARALLDLYNEANAEESPWD